MSDGSSKEKFLAKCSAWDSKNLPGILVSGGSDSNGCLPWKKYIPLLKKIKSQTNLHVSIHIGLADPIIVKQLSETGIDTVMFDLVPTPEIYNRVFRLKNGYERMLLMIKELEKTSIQVAPHIILGLDHGKVFSEYPILDSISNLNISTLVIIQFMPLHEHHCSINPQQKMMILLIILQHPVYAFLQQKLVLDAPEKSLILP